MAVAACAGMYVSYCPTRRDAKLDGQDATYLLGGGDVGHCKGTDESRKGLMGWLKWMQM